MFFFTSSLLYIALPTFIYKDKNVLVTSFLPSIAPHNVPLGKSVLVTPFLPLSFAVPLSVLSCLKFSNNALVSDSDTFEVAPVSLIEAKGGSNYG
jgi:hypothetical protein